MVIIDNFLSFCEKIKRKVTQVIFGNKDIHREDEKVGPELSFRLTEAYNTLRENIYFAFPGSKQCKVIGITSSLASEGKSFTSINLGYTLAKDGNKVLICSADIRKGGVEKYLKCPTTPGLSDILTGNIELDPKKRIIVKTKLHENLFLLPCGKFAPNPSELLGSEQTGILVNFLRDKYDYIIVDLPPVNLVADTISISKNVDGMICVVRNDYSKKREVNNMLTQLKYAKVNILGFVFNDFDRTNDRSSYYNYYGRKSTKKEEK